MLLIAPLSETLNFKVAASVALIRHGRSAVPHWSPSESVKEKGMLG